MIPRTKSFNFFSILPILHFQETHHTREKEGALRNRIWWPLMTTMMVDSR
ncbi:hypothetical protein HanIR_Chr09g0393581 [Helianthus annuus]|nr:hypothetical protein HanIR_Chr09g0393581 [Helianthus annuus]